MRVLHINVNYLVSALHQTMIEHLNQLGLENKVFVPVYDKSKSVVSCKDYVLVSECFKKWDRLFYYKKQNKIINAVLGNYDVGKFDVIHAYTLFTDGNVAMELKKKYGIPYVVAVRNTDVNYFFKKMFFLRKHGVSILENASAVFFLSPMYKETVFNKYIPEDKRADLLKKSYIIPNGIDDFWHENLFQRDYKTIVERIENNRILKCIYVGAIDKNKNIGLTVSALNQMNANGWKASLTAIGRIADKKVYESLCRNDLFTYIEPKNKEQLIDYFREADLFVMPSHNETFGLVYAEAMSQGLPVIYTRGQGFDGQFEDGVVGFPVSDRSIAEVADAIVKITSNYEKISRLCVGNVSKFLWDDICSRYISLYKSLAIDN